MTRDRNRGVTDERFAYERCTACGSLHLVNVPADLGPFYGGEYFVLPTRAQLERVARSESYRIGFLKPHVLTGRVVEIGAGYGVFARIASGAGYDYTGIEMSARCCDYMRSELGVEAIQSDAPAAVLAQLPPSDAITLWHVLEHLPDPWDVVAQAAANLAPGGILVCAMPNPEALQFRLLGARWPHVDAPRHLFLIPARELGSRAAQAGLEVVSVTSNDRGGRHWNVFGWQHALLRPSAGAAARLLALQAGRVAATVLAPWERRDLRGSTYTAVMRRPA